MANELDLEEGFSTVEDALKSSRSSEEGFSTVQQALGPREDVPELTWEQVGEQGLRNSPASAKKLFSDLWHAVSHPIQTGGTMIDIASGAIKLIDGPDGDPDEAKAQALAQQYTDDYGIGKPGWKNFKYTLATDPLRVLTDLSTFFTGAGGAVRGVALAGRTARAGAPHLAPHLRNLDLVGALDNIPLKPSPRVSLAVNKTLEGTDALGRGLLKAGVYTDPFVLAGKGSKLAAKKAVLPVASGLQGALTGVSPHAVSEWARAGFKGGDFGKDLRTQMRHTTEGEQIVNNARSAAAELHRAASKAYEANMKGTRESTTVIPFGPIDKAFRKVADRGTFKGESIDVASEGAFKVLGDIIDHWRMLDPAEYHTPMGLDGLKRKIWSYTGKIPLDNKPARSMVNEVYHSVRKEIEAASPQYKKAMKDYEQARNLSEEINHALGLGKKTRVDTALRKLHSVMRNNVNTNYGMRAKYADVLTEAGAPTLMSQIAGSQASAMLPRGITAIPAVSGGMGMAYGTAMGGTNPLWLGALGLTSPRLMGEAIHAGGRVAGGLDKAAKTRLGRALLHPAGHLSAYQAGGRDELQRRIDEILALEGQK